MLLLPLRDAPLPVFLSSLAVTLFFDFIGPTHRRAGARGTPWHPRHIAERYGLFAIITLGEGVIGTIAAVSAVDRTARAGARRRSCWSFAGTGLTFGMWWCYFMIPSGQVI